MADWFDPPDVDLPADLCAAVGGHPLVTEALVRRGFADPAAARAFLDPTAYRPASPWELPGMEQAVTRLEEAIRLGERICVWGDFDVDGQTSTTLLMATLGDLGADVSFHIPHRQRESHGIKLPVLERVIEEEGAQLILTCDTGVSAHRAIRFAQSRGVDVVVTDHHDVPPELPDARAVVNPKRVPAAHPLRQLPGVGCAYKVAQALCERVGRAGAAERHLDLVALGIVADIATQVDDTRYLLQRGLEALRQTERLGLRALMEIAELPPGRVTEEHIGYELAPRLNSLGRLADASTAVEFLTTDDLTQARVMAQQLDGLNEQRKLLVDQVTQAALAQIEREPALLEYSALVLSHSSWPGGVVGIVAGRLAERYHRPAILITEGSDGLARGSARSVKGCNISEALAANAALLHRFGGHPMAAGLSIDRGRIDEFRRVLSRTIDAMCGEIEEPPLKIDAFLPLGQVSLAVVEQIERLAPFGPGNPPLTLAARGLTVRSHAGLGRKGLHRQVIVEDETGETRRVVWWRGAHEPVPEGRFDLAYSLRVNEYRGNRQAQMEWVDARLVELLAPELESPKLGVRVIDCRRRPHRQRLLAELRARGEALIWSEAEAREAVGGRDRTELEPCSQLAIWTTPPGLDELRAALSLVDPDAVYLFGIEPDAAELRPVLRRLAGLTKHAMAVGEGWIELERLAAAMAHREPTVRAGLDWLSAQGHLTIAEEDDGAIRLVAGGRPDKAHQAEARRRLRSLLVETRAFRAFFARAEKDLLVERMIGRG